MIEVYFMITQVCISHRKKFTLLVANFLTILLSVLEIGDISYQDHFGQNRNQCLYTW